MTKTLLIGEENRFQKQQTEHIRILVIEDNIGDFELIEEVVYDIQDMQIDLAHVMDIQAALKQLENNSYDIVFLDLSLPDAQGLEGLNAILTEYPDLPVIILSGLKNKAVTIEAIRHGAQDYLIKGQIDSYILERAVLFALERVGLNTELKRINLIKDEFLSIVSHDLKNPMGYILSGVRFIKMLNKDSFTEEVMDIINNCEKYSEFGLHLINDLIKMGRQDNELSMQLETTCFKIKDILFRAKEVIRFQQKQKQLEVIINIEENFIIEADYFRLLQVMINVLSNAVKYLPLKGIIKINTKLIKEKENEADFFLIDVEDNGAGIPKDKLETIFDKNQQARQSDKTKGTGLGLAICREICQLHGGQIWAESELDQGTIIHILIPIKSNQIQQRTNE